MSFTKQIVLFFIIFLLVQGCKEKYTPKPRSYFRIHFPEKTYHRLNNDFPYNFDVADYASILSDSRNPEEPYWINISVPENRSEIHISYYKLHENEKPLRTLLSEFMEESRKLAYKHSIKADAIEEQMYVNPRDKVFGTIYRINGNAASPIQFFLTDSTNHFLRGALYIREVPNIDSLKPVIDFLEPDIINIIETASWK